MAYTLIATQTLTTATASVTFSSIPGTFKDLVLEITGTATSADNAFFRFNSDSNTNYSETLLYGNGTSALSTRDPNYNRGMFGLMGTVQTVIIANVQSYANANVNKTVLSRASVSNSRVDATVSLWRSTAAITSFECLMSGTTFATGTSFKLWGVS